MVRSVMLTSVGIGVALMVACGGAEPAKDGPVSAKPEGKAKSKVVEVDPDGRPPAKIPRPPFLSLPPSAADQIVGKVEGRRLIAAPQRGPFGGGQTVTVFYSDPGPDGTTTLGGVVVIGTVAHPIPVDNPGKLVGQADVTWGNTDLGWAPVLMSRWEIDGKETQANQVFLWSGKAVVHGTAQEQRIGSVANPLDVRRALQ